MAKYIPDGWKVTQKAQALFEENAPHFHMLVSRMASKFYGLPGIDRGDLIQEGLTATLYALDGYDPARGSRDALVTRVVQNALYMVAGEATAQVRHPHRWVQNDAGKWRFVPDKRQTDPETVDVAAPCSTEMDLDAIRARVAQRTKLAKVRAQLAPEAQRVFDAKMSLPAGLIAAARNLMGRRVSDLSKLPNAALAAYTGLTEGQVGTALRDIRMAMGGVL